MASKRHGIARVVVALIVVLAAASVALYAAWQKGMLPGAASKSEQAAISPDPPVMEEVDFAEMSWSDIAALSRSIEAAPDDAARQEIAYRAGIVDENGALVDKRIRLELTNGYALDVRLAGIMHDEKADGTGKVGLTFITAGALARGVMNQEATAQGGWEQSYARAWLQEDGMALLPEELRDVIIPVTKTTNNVGDTNAREEVSDTSDTLWLFSPREVVGDVTWERDTYGNDGWGIDASLNQEGEQYALFEEHGVTATSAGDGILKLDDLTGKSTWLYRTPQGANWAHSNATDLFYQVSDAGLPKGYGNPNQESAYVVGFCV
jgi:hypothetical protein